jgi:hypothetical protein
MGGLYILFTSLKNVHKKNVFLIWLVNFQNCAAIEKKVTMVSKYALNQICWYPKKFSIENMPHLFSNSEC